MKPIRPLLQWTPEIYLLLFFLWYGNTYALDVNEIHFSDFQTSFPLVLTILLITQMFLRKRLLGIAMTAIMGLGSLVVAVGLLLQNWSVFKPGGPAVSIIVFGILVIITNLTMALWMGQKYKLIQVLND